MSQTVTAVQAPSTLGRIDGHTNFATQEFVVTSGVTVNEGDFVKLSSGQVTNDSMAGARIVGMALGTTVGDGTKTVLVCIDPNMRYLVKTAGSNFSSSTVGEYYDLSTATTVDQSSASATTGGLLLLATGDQTNPTVNPGSLQGVNTAAYGIFKVVESFLNGPN